MNSTITAVAQSLFWFDYMTYRFTAYDSDVIFTHYESEQTYSRKFHMDVPCTSDECLYFKNGSA